MARLGQLQNEEGDQDDGDEDQDDDYDDQDNGDDDQDGSHADIFNTQVAQAKLSRPSSFLSSRHRGKNAGR